MGNSKSRKIGNQWKETLLFFLNNKPSIKYSYSNSYTKRDLRKILKKLDDYSEVELQECLDMLAELKYLTHLKIIGDDEEYCYDITKKGIEIALKLQEHEDNNSYREVQKMQNLILCFLTGLLALSGIFQIYHYVNPNVKGMKMIYGVLVLIFTFGGLIGYWVSTFLKKN